MRNHSTSKLTTTMLTQLQQNEYLRVKLIQLQKVSREKDNFYLSIFHQQQKVTQKVLSQLFLAQEKIKTLIRQRICQNWKQQYDTLATSITSYVQDVNNLIEEYRKTRQKLQQKAYNTSDLYEYYSNTLQQCGKKFDQAQIIIQELNNQINEFKKTVKQLDQELEQKLIIIDQQNMQIESLQTLIQKHLQENDAQKIQNLKKSHKKLEKDNQALQRSIKEMQKLVVEMKKQLKNRQNENTQLIEEISHKDDVIRETSEMLEMNEKMSQQIDELNQMIQNKDEEIKKLKDQTAVISVRKQSGEFVTTFNPYGNPLSNSTLNNAPPYANNLHQLHLKKILQQQELIKNLNNNLNFLNKNIQQLQQENIRLKQMQNEYDNRQIQLKKQIQNLKFKQLQNEFNSKQRQQEVKNIQIYGEKCQQQIQDWKLQMEGLYEEMARSEQRVQQLEKLLDNKEQIQSKINYLEKINSQLVKQIQQLKKVNYENSNLNFIYQQKLRVYEKEKQQSKQNFQNLLEQFQDFVKKTEKEKFRMQEQKRETLALSPFQVQQTLIIRNRTVSVIQNPKMKKRALLIDIQNNESTNKIQQRFKPTQFIHTQNTNFNKTKKFNLQSLQQKANPYANFIYSPKIGQIFDSMHLGRNLLSSRW